MAEKTVEYDKPFGGFAFSKKEIEANVLADESGTYLLSEGARDENNNLFVTYVGRAVVGESEDLRTRLKAHLNNPNEQKKDAKGNVLKDKDGNPISIYTHFWFQYKKTALDAYEQECKDYHKYGAVHTLRNKIHPAKNKGSNRLCPVCRT